MCVSARGLDRVVSILLMARYHSCKPLGLAV